RTNVSVITTATPELVRTMEAVDEQSLVIGISLHRYMKEPIQLAEELYKRGINVISINDSKVAPIDQSCTRTFTLEQFEQSTIDLMPALFSFLNVLTAGMMTFDPEYYDIQRVHFDDINHDFILNRWR